MKRIHIIKSKHNESGFTLLTALIMLCVGSILIIPVLSYVGTGIKAIEVKEDRTLEFYAQDSGIQDAMNKISQDYSYGGFQLPRAMGDTVSYTLDNLINNKLVNVAIEKVWPLEGLEPQPAFVPKSNTISVTGFVADSEISGQQTYQLDLVCLQDALKETVITEVTVWLPSGFSYISDSSDGFTTANPTQVPYHGGIALKWDLNYIEFEDLPLPGMGHAPAASVPISRFMTFRFGPEKYPVGAFCWIKTSSADFYWDTETSTYKIISEATDPVTSESSQTEAYVSRGRLKDRLCVAHGDYRAIGNSLMIDTNHDQHGIRDILLSSSSASIWKKTSPSGGDLPHDAEVVLAYLYWSGWRDSNDQAYTDVKFGIENVTDDPGNTYWTYPASNKTAILENKHDEYSYSCRADVTLQMGMVTDEIGQAEFRFTVADGHEDDDSFGETGDDWSFAGWSVIIVYSSPSEKAHRVYLYDDFLYVGNSPPKNSGEFVLSGFEAPGDSHGYLTYFVGEGDECWKPEYIELNGVMLSDADNPATNIMNGKSSATGASYDGVDIDTYNISNMIHEGDTSATVRYYSNRDIWNLVYTVVSFRSDLTESFEGYPVAIIGYD